MIRFKKKALKEVGHNRKAELPKDRQDEKRTKADSVISENWTSRSTERWAGFIFVGGVNGLLLEPAYMPNAERSAEPARVAHEGGRLEYRREWSRRATKQDFARRTKGHAEYLTPGAILGHPTRKPKDSVEEDRGTGTENLTGRS
ncbi:MAG: hypothetical protein Q9210_003322 [Variospora velana]